MPFTITFSSATFLLVSGASHRTVMKVLGHSQIGLTMNTYPHVLPEIERAAVAEAAKHLFGLAARMAVRRPVVIVSTGAESR
ncbi:hypothetical protein [Micromonospora siamensis]|uniref:Phage integrase family protein n=1 Tax=Micromonospora siamensis TaxID=299152 RepID=A0A1C5JXV5_9ACTN|nr:hypothetical protein [Micromonospora siamensis]SCG75089.1 hypothetical protein GA0074704_5123 [Micromonospora siamensis]